MSTTRSIDTFDRFTGSPAEIYDRWFVPSIGAPFATPVVDSAALRPGQRVLDVGCGTGVVARRAAQLVGPSGHVAGIDGNPDMLQVARDATSAGTTIEWRQASADGLPFPDNAFDAVLCSLSLQFFADKVGALSEMRRVVVPGGRVAIGVPGPTPSLFEALHDLLAERLGAEVAAFVHAVFALDDADRLHLLLARAGLDEIETSSRPIPLHLDPPADFFWQYMLGTPLAAAANALESDQRADLEAEIMKRWQPFTTDKGGIDTDVGLILGTATHQNA